MNILYITEVDWRDSVVFDTHILAESLVSRGHKVYAIDCERKANFRVAFRTQVMENVSRVQPGTGVVLRHPGSIRAHLKRPGFMRTRVIELASNALAHYLEIRRCIKEYNIDIIVQNRVLTSGLQSLYLARKFNVPIVFRCVDMLHRLMPYAGAKQLTKALESKLYSSVDAVLSLTPQYAEYIKELGADESKIRLLVFPLDTDVFRPSLDCSGIREQWGIGAEDRVILWVGNLYWFSGVGEFIRQLPEVIAQIPEAKLVIVSGGPPSQEMEQTVTELGLSEKVVFTGYQPFEILPQFINLADICINPFPINDMTRDLFSAKIIQYLACGKPTVSTSLPGIKTLLKGESQGVVYADTIADMAKEVTSLLKSPERCQRLGQAGMDYVRQAHSYDAVIGKFEEYLGEVIQNRK